MRGRRHSSRQREAVLSVVRAAVDHPTADDVYHRVRRALPHVALGTVYRNLRVLADAGLILAVEGAPGGVTHYDRTIAPHHHFHCTTCGGICDVAPQHDPQMRRTVGRQIDGDIRTLRMDFFGICGSCLRATSDEGRAAMRRPGTAAGHGSHRS